MEPAKEDLWEAKRQTGIGENKAMQKSLREAVLSLARDRYGTEGESLFVRYPGFAVLRHPNQKWYGVIMDLSREKLGLPGEGMVDALNVKCDPVMSGSLRLQPGILPGYHMNKERWITIVLDGTVDLEQVGILLDISYDLVGTKPRRKKKQVEEEST